jgi:hypothetical protein
MFFFSVESKLVLAGIRVLKEVNLGILWFAF